MIVLKILSKIHVHFSGTNSEIGFFRMRPPESTFSGYPKWIHIQYIPFSGCPEWIHIQFLLFSGCPKWIHIQHIPSSGCPKWIHIQYVNYYDTSK